MNTIKEYYKQLGLSPAIKQAYEEVFATDKGKIVLEDLKHKFNYYVTTGTIDPYAAIKESNERAVICYILSLARQLSEDDLSIINKVLASEDED